MPNIFTRVPDGPAPQLSGAMVPVVWVADLFMWLMWSRPGGLSLRNTWVTPSTAGLGIGVVVGGGIVWALLIGGSHSVAGIIGLAVLAVLWVGSLAVCVTWVGQRLARGRG
jgi:hypothetical protein